MLLEPNRRHLEAFVDVIFRRATKGFVSIRSFREGDTSEKFRFSSSPVGRRDHLLDVVEDDARRAGPALWLQLATFVLALVGLAAVPISMWRLTLTGQAMARVFSVEPFNALVGMLILIASLIIVRAVLQLARDEIANATAALMKARVRAVLYEHVLRLGAGHFDQKRTGDAVLALVECA